MKIKYLTFIFFIFVQFTMLYSQSKNDEIKFLELIQQYNNRDGASGYDISFKISKMLIINDTIFFKIMKDHKNVFLDWLNELQYQTFTVYDYEDDVDKILLKTMLNKLKELMINTTEKYLNSSEYQLMAKKLYVKLKNIKIRFIE